MKCPKCHFENPDDSSFCNKCGTQILPAKEIRVTETIETLEELKEIIEKGINKKKSWFS